MGKINGYDKIMIENPKKIMEFNEITGGRPFALY